MSDVDVPSADIGWCINCGRSTAHPEIGVAGAKNETEVTRARVCSAECHDAARRFLARRSPQLQPAAAGMLVAVLGIATGVIFLLTGRELGRVLVCVGLFGAGTTRLAYPDAIPLTLAKWRGREQMGVWLQWLGVFLATSALLVAAVFMMRR